MVEVSAIVGLSQSLNAIREIVKAMIGLRDAEVFRTKANELLQVANEAFERALDARAAQSDLLDEVGALKAQIAKPEDWHLEKQRYELKEVSAGAFAYALKAAMQGDEPMHWLCAACCQNNKKSIMQTTGGGGWGVEVFGCPVCSAEIRIIRPMSL